MKMISEIFKLKLIKADWICGIPAGAVPMATALSLMTDIPQLLLRKERKTMEHVSKLRGF